MLDQFRQDPNDGQNFAPQSNKKKVVLVLSGAMLLLFGTLFVFGVFGSDDEKERKSSKIDITVLDRLKDVENRLNKLETNISVKSQEYDHEQLAKIFNDNVPNTPQPEPSQPLVSFDQSIDIPIPTIAEFPISPDHEYIPNNSNQKVKSFDQKTISSASKQNQQKMQSSDLGVKTHKVQRGETLSLISQRYYGTPKKWRLIYEANKDKITNMNQLKVGTTLSIPESK